MPSPYAELLIGCGRRRQRLYGDGSWRNLTTLDMNPAVDPDIVADLERLPYSWGQDDSYDEIHAYEVLEHLGGLGDYLSLFAQFSELWRILKPGGLLAATVPSERSMWAFGDPGHRRIINRGTLTFLSQESYQEQCDREGGRTPLSDYRFCYKADFNVEGLVEDETTFAFALRAVKPSRIRWAFPK